MKLSTRCRYGTRAMLQIARHYKKGPVRRIDIERSEGISSAYLENILISLKKQNLIRPIRGANGGFTLVKTPENITMYHIVSALEGTISPVHCLDQKEECSRSEHCIARKFWADFHEIQVKTLKSATLQSLLDLERTSEEFDYYI